MARKTTARKTTARKTTEMNISDTDKVKSVKIWDYFTLTPSRKGSATYEADQDTPTRESTKKKSKKEAEAAVGGSGVRRSARIRESKSLSEQIEVSDWQHEDAGQNKAQTQALNEQIEIPDSQDEGAVQNKAKAQDSSREDSMDLGSSDNEVSSGSFNDSAKQARSTSQTNAFAKHPMTPLTVRVDSRLNLNSTQKESPNKSLTNTSEDAYSPTIPSEGDKSENVSPTATIRKGNSKKLATAGKSATSVKGKSKAKDDTGAGDHAASKKNLAKAHALGKSDHFVAQSTGQRRNSQKALRDANPDNPNELNIQIKCDVCGNISTDPNPRFDERNGRYARRQIICYNCKANGRDEKAHPTHTPVDGRETIREQNVPNRKTS